MDKDKIISPVIENEIIDDVAERYNVEIDPDNATQYKLCQVIVMLEEKC